MAKTWIFRPVKLRQKNTWRQCGFLDQQNYIEKVRKSDVEISRNLVSHVLTQYRHRIDVSSMWCVRWDFDQRPLLLLCYNLRTNKSSCL